MAEIDVIQHRLAPLREVWHVLTPALADEVRGGQVGEDPVQHETPLERSTLVGPALVVVRGSERGHDGLQAGWRADGRQPLRGADIRGAEHADLAC